MVATAPCWAVQEPDTPGKVPALRSGHTGDSELCFLCTFYTFTGQRVPEDPLTVKLHTCACAASSRLATTPWGPRVQCCCLRWNSDPGRQRSWASTLGVSRHTHSQLHPRCLLGPHFRNGSPARKTAPQTLRVPRCRARLLDTCHWNLK